MKKITKKKEDNVVELNLETGEITPQSEPQNISAVASSEDMELALRLVAKRFNLGKDYTMTQFKDSSSKCLVTLANANFEVTVLIKDKDNSFNLLIDEEA